MQASSLQKRRVTGAHAFFLGAFLALLALTPAILPYGGRFVTRGDFIEQQLPFILETRRILRSGLNSYSFNTFLGAPAVGSYAFYTLGSVFVWPLALLPKALIPFGISVMAVLKHAVCALTSFCYLRRMVKEERLALLGSVLYTFSAFTIVNTQFYHFLEVIAFFPLILLGMEDAMSDHPRRGLLALFCGLNTLTNYYFMLSSALLAALYFVFRFFSADWKPRRTFKNVFMLIFECGAGCALAGVLLVPSMLFMLSITRTGAGDTSVLMQHYSASTLLERLRALIMPIESNVVHAYYGDAPSWASTAAYLPLFGLTGAVSAFAQKKSRWLRGLLLALAVCCVVPVLCGAFALETNISYTRWWYGLALMLTLVTLTALEDFDAHTWRTSFLILTALTALLTVPFLLPEWLAKPHGARRRRAAQPPEGRLRRLFSASFSSAPRCSAAARCSLCSSESCASPSHWRSRAPLPSRNTRATSPSATRTCFPAAKRPAMACIRSPKSPNRRFKPSKRRIWISGSASTTAKKSAITGFCAGQAV
ncbi:MAG: YfhO family protein [Christensenellales bacterium]